MIDLNDDIKERLRLSNEIYRTAYKVGKDEGYHEGLIEGMRRARAIVEEAYGQIVKKQAG